MTINDKGCYEQRAVLFLDILGFKNKIKTKSAEEIFEALLSVQESAKLFNSDERSKIKATIFSDSIVISFPRYDNFGVVQMVSKARYIFWKLLEHGMLCRGGIASGDLYHHDGIVFGPALIDAYETESNVANYPRIVLANSAIAEYDAFIKNTPPEVAKPYLGHFYDFDNVYCVEIFGYVGWLPGDKEIVCRVEKDQFLTRSTIDTRKVILDRRDRIVELVNNELNEGETRLDVRQKLEWLLNYARRLRIETAD